MKNTVLITGSSTGIGRATAIYFHDKGWNVIATMRTPEKEEELQKLDDVFVTRLDVTDSDSITSAVDEGLAKFGRIDALVNNAGYGAYGPLEAFPMENIRRQFDTNVIGLLETDFGGRSFDFTNDESMTEYQEMVQMLLSKMGVLMADAAPASFCAEVIWNAVTDGTSTIRYIAGKDAEENIKNRKALDDEAFIGGIKQFLGMN